MVQTSEVCRRKIIFALAAFSFVASHAFAKYSGGTGTSDDPYKITSTTDLLALAGDTNDYGKHFVLMTDIDLNPYMPDGQIFTTAVIAPDTDNSNDVFDGSSFMGVFDGAGHRITGLTIDTYGTKKGFLGLFGRIANKGVVKNLDLERTYIKGGDKSNCLGGLVGQNWGTSIINCSSLGIITAGSESSYIGGLIGDNGGDVSGCFSAGVVVCGNDSFYIGGLAGDNYNSGINNCYSTVAVTGGNNSYQFGGLVGRNEGSISNCYSRGIVAGGAGAYWFGRLVGLDKGSVANCYFLAGSGPNNGSGTPLTDTQMKQRSSFVGWDFAGETANGYENLWRLCNEWREYPKLWWQYLPGDITCPDGKDIYDIDEMCRQWLIKKMPPDLAPAEGDGIVNFADFAAFAEGWVTIYDIDDLLDFAHQWLWNAPNKWPADVWPWPDGDGKVNMKDLAVICDFWLQ